MLLSLLLGCKPPASPTAALDADAAQAAARTTREAGLVPVAAKFGIRLETPTSSVSAVGAMLVRPPDHFRVEISGPIGPPQVVIACDGTTVAAFLAGKNKWYRAPDADTALRGLTGGAAGIDVVTALLLGQYVEPSGGSLTASPPQRWPEPDDGSLPQWRWEWCTADGACVHEGLAVATGHLASVDAAAGGRTLMDARLVPGATWPEELIVDLPTLGAKATVKFNSWAPASPPDAAFVLTPPAGATVEPLTLAPKP